MNFRRHVTNGNGKCHYLLCDEPAARLPPASVRFWKDYGLPKAARVEVAYEDGQLIGFFRYKVIERNIKSGAKTRTLYACGTWVAKEYRRAGIAARLWQRAIYSVDPDSISATVVTHAGQKLVEYFQTHCKTKVRLQNNRC